MLKILMKQNINNFQLTNEIKKAFKHFNNSKPLLNT